MKTFFKTAIVLAIGLTCGIGAMAAYRAVASYALSATASSLAAAAEQHPPAAPVELIIPSIKVDAPIKPVGIDAKGNIGVTVDAIHVAWFKYGPRPGVAGVAIIDGHLDTRDTPQAVFYNLDQLTVGDTIEVRTASGTNHPSQTLTFTVTGTQRIPYNTSTTKVFASKSSVPQLDLITCTGDWVPAKKIYNERLVVFTQLVSYNGR